MAAADKTGPIKLPRTWTNRGADGDAPEPRARSASELITGICKDAMEIGRDPNASKTQIARMSTDLETLHALAQQGVELAGRVGGGGVRGSGAITILASVVLASGISLGAPSLTSSDDLAQTTVTAKRNDERLSAVEARQADEERRARRIQGLTVRWLGDTQSQYCTALDALVQGVNRLAPEAKGKQREEIRIDCELASLPPELVRLEADLDIAEGSGL